jgi:hypothetical protein
MVQCPSSRPYYNDTRLADSPLLSEPQLCVSVCGALRDPEKLNVVSSEPYRCSTTGRISADASRSGTGNDDNTVAIVGGVVAAFLICVLIVVIVVRSRRTRQKADIAPMTYDASAAPYGNGNGRAHSNAVYMASPGQARQVDAYAFDPQSQYAAPHHDRSFTAADEDSYLDVSTAPMNPYSMSDAALFGAEDDDFNYTLNAGSGNDMQSTRM